MKKLARLTFIFSSVIGVGFLLAATVSVSADSKSERLDIKTATPIQLGIRYGQAAGVALVCYGLRVSPNVEKLKARFTGSDLEIFNNQANKILAAWEKTLRCENSGGPNECKLSHTWSCQQGLRELGPKGTVLPGLVEQRVK